MCICALCLIQYYVDDRAEPHLLHCPSISPCVFCLAARRLLPRLDSIHQSRGRIRDRKSRESSNVEENFPSGQIMLRRLEQDPLKGCTTEKVPFQLWNLSTTQDIFVDMASIAPWRLSKCDVFGLIKDSLCHALKEAILWAKTQSFAGNLVGSWVPQPHPLSLITGQGVLCRQDMTDHVISLGSSLFWRIIRHTFVC